MPSIYGPTCAVDGCEKQNFKGSPFCGMHKSRMYRHGDVSKKSRRSPGEGFIKRGYWLKAIGGVRRPIHLLIAEKALGKPLPKNAQVHHANENKLDNTNSNLVICPNGAYHQLLHARLRAMHACGNPWWRMCGYCKKYDSLDNMSEAKRKNTASYYHKFCAAEYSKAHYVKAKPLNQKENQIEISTNV